MRPRLGWAMHAAPTAAACRPYRCRKQLQCRRRRGGAHDPDRVRRRKQTPTTHQQEQQELGKR
eukprot:976606-Pyramimonas_sp.AAC.1